MESLRILEIVLENNGIRDDMEARRVSAPGSCVSEARDGDRPRNVSE